MTTVARRRGAPFLPTLAAIVLAGVLAGLLLLVVALPLTSALALSVAFGSPGPGGVVAVGIVGLLLIVGHWLVQAAIAKGLVGLSARPARASAQRCSRSLPAR